MNSLLLSQWTLTFFGLPADYRPKLWAEIFDLVYHSNGGFGHDEVYSMPSFRRRFYLKYLARKKEDEKQQSNKQSTAKGGKVHTPNIPQVRKRTPRKP